jgi:GDP-4-dehydro-6-deoxy-D-mannose reductase
MRVLVTGADGFVGKHLSRYLREQGDTVIGWAGPRHAGAPDVPHESEVVDVRDATAVSRAVARARPDAIVHLAAISSVVHSHAEPVLTVEINTLGALHTCIAAKALTPSPRLLIVSSGEVYGPTPPGEPAAEGTPLAPTSPYAASKAAAETFASQFARSYGLYAICARPFNHLGAGQAPNFAIPAFARQLAGTRRSGGKGHLSVGSLDPIRDFSHVDDVVAAYRLLLEQGVRGEAYNVCSGVGRSIRSVLDELIELSGVDVDVETDPSKVRPVEVPILVGSSVKLRALGWTPRRTVREALSEVLADAERHAR